MILAIDFGASRIRGALYSDGELVHRYELATPPSGIAESIAHVAEQVLRRAGVNRVDKAGVASVGPIDYSRGEVVGAPNLGDPHVPVVEVLGAYAEEVYILNDAPAMLYAELVFSGAGGDVALVSIGTGIGGGIAIGGRLLLGRRGNAHEVGHIVLETRVPVRCGCGGIGHWEALAGGRWIHRTAKMLAEEWKGGRTPCLEQAVAGELSPERLYGTCRGDPFAEYVIDYINSIHAAGIASIKAVYDPEVVYLAGGMFWKNRDVLLSGIRKHLPAYVMGEDPPVVVPASFGEDQGLMGGVAVAYNPPEELLSLMHKGEG